MPKEASSFRSRSSSARQACPGNPVTSVVMLPFSSMAVVMVLGMAGRLVETDYSGLEVGSPKRNPGAVRLRGA